MVASSQGLGHKGEGHQDTLVLTDTVLTDTVLKAVGLDKRDWWVAVQDKQDQMAVVLDKLGRLRDRLM